MPTLDWIGKKAVENHHLEIPFRMLKSDPDLSVGNIDSGNLIIQGDNLEALKALLPYYAGRVKCICIDPPYNTGNEGWAYNDNVKSPEIVEWLNKVVKIDDLSRHDKWLCMMYPRLQLLKRFLKKDGVIFINIDDNEQTNLKIILDEIFGQNNFIANFCWRKTDNQANIGNIANVKEYILCYCKDKSFFYFNKMKLSERASKEYRYKDDRGKFRRAIMLDKTRGKNYYDVITPSNNILKGPWMKPEEEFLRMVENNEIYWASGKQEQPYGKIYLHESKGQISSDLLGIEFGTNQQGSVELEKIFGKRVFDFPKPKSLIEHFITIGTEKDSIVLDSFAGTGTTAHALLEKNKNDNGNRRFILIEMIDDICKNITSERIKRVINGYKFVKSNGESEVYEPINSGFKYCILKEPLFDEFGNIRSDVKFKDLAFHIFFSETGTPLTSNPKIGKTPLIGLFKDSAYYLLFNGILGDKSVNGGNVLTSSILEKLPKHKGKKIIFGEGCRLSSQRLKKDNIAFKQIPYEIKVK